MVHREQCKLYLSSSLFYARGLASGIILEKDPSPSHQEMRDSHSMAQQENQGNCMYDLQHCARAQCIHVILAAKLLSSFRQGGGGWHIQYVQSAYLQLGQCSRYLTKSDKNCLMSKQKKSDFQ